MKSWYEVGYWVVAGDNTNHWMPLLKETRRADKPYRYRTERRALLAARREHERGRVSYKPRLMEAQSQRKVKEDA